MEGQQLRHDLIPVYLWITIDGTLSYREHLIKVAGKIHGVEKIAMETHVYPSL